MRAECKPPQEEAEEINKKEITKETERSNQKKEEGWSNVERKIHPTFPSKAPEKSDFNIAQKTLSKNTEANLEHSLIAIITD